MPSFFFGQPCRLLLPVVINDLYVVRMIRVPTEADSPLVIDADAMLPLSTSRKGFQPISGGRAEIIDRRGRVNLTKLPVDSPLDVIGDGSCALAVEQLLGFGIAEAPNHPSPRLP